MRFEGTRGAWTEAIGELVTGGLANSLEYAYIYIYIYMPNTRQMAIRVKGGSEQSYMGCCKWEMGLSPKNEKENHRSAMRMRSDLGNGS